MVPQIFWSCLFAWFAGSLDAQASLIGQEDNKLVATNGKYYISKRMWKQTEAFLFCDNFEVDLQLVEISNPKKNADVEEFLLTQDSQTAWTAGRSGSIPFEEYIWNDIDVPMNYTNWEITPDKSSMDKSDWYYSGIVILQNPLGKWLLKHGENLHPALCESVSV